MVYYVYYWFVHCICHIDQTAAVVTFQHGGKTETPNILWKVSIYVSAAVIVAFHI